MPNYIPEYYTEVILDVSCENAPIIVPTKQLDNLTRHLRVSMYDSLTGDSVALNSSLNAELHIRRPDGVLVELRATISNNKVEASLTEDCLAIAGKALVDIKILEGQKVFSAASFALDIQQTATGSHSETRGILTTANLQAISKTRYEALSQKDLNTLYVVVDGQSASLYWGEIPISGGTRAIIGTMIAVQQGFNSSNTGIASFSGNLTS